MNDLQNKSIISKSLLYGLMAACVIIAITFMIMLALHRYYDTNSPFDAGLFGNYGDFIGGVIGTIVAFYSAYLLVRTFENQVKTNDSVITANNAAIAASQMEGYQSQLERFDSMFNSLLSSYLKAIESYNYQIDGSMVYGRNAFEHIVNRFIDCDFENNYEYQRRNYAAVEEYADFYAKERTHLSVHLRLLYLVVSLIANSDLDEDDKVNYAKLIRGQMSDAEMLIVRYNCSSDYGIKMRDCCNTFNLTKHAPIMHLLEFKKYYAHIVQKVQEAQTENLAELIGGLEAMFIVLRKKATQMLYADGTSEDVFTTNKRYSVKMTTNAGHRSFEILFTKDKTVNRVGGGYRLKAAEKALDKFDNEDMLLDLFFDFAHELFIYSNFREYNKEIEIRKKPIQGDQNKYVFSIKITGKKSLALSKIQVEKRDNPEVVE